MCPSAQQTAKAAGKKPGFFSNLVAELKKVVWPSRPDVIKLTTMVLVVAIAVGILLGVVDYGFSWFIDNVFVK
ncbi:MAG: preprotein translocase subunit SecE [Dehalococcoides mccartyi]|jgi:preprotein translocase, SecE subunit, bacterial|uniref:Protein translocase subunit SecE n=3 Tax=root TaxID=1 RepID=A0A0V8LXB1_9CHLR|nr:MULTISPECIES: preprotein translocase subunit SecE [Dehalococcoides]AAW39772.1 preprotein translocase, SecE subunit [Dehalococcoides mccartyi 195]AII59634.1 preprotein translocase subunit SecE [Dehalococcoides mccartyi CG4]AQU03266.1 preprotein translocase subunit SecE [Dehalococcoides mccartyi]AQU04583.1 preprotein translocase subunit SecE [Dehalococcoides mccartyi]KSV16068.1 preprotein translocase subunit SecE [Dehalococcoides mccartyi]